MKRALLSLPIMLCFGAPAHAQLAVEDVALLAEQAKTNAESVFYYAKDMAQQVATYAEVVNTYVNAVTNTIAIPQAAIARVEGLYYRAEGIANGAAMIIGGDGTMMQRARGLRYLGQNAGRTPADSAASIAELRRQTLQQFEDNAKLLGLESERKVISDELVATAAANSATAVGRMAAQQAQAQASQAIGSQLQQVGVLLRQQQDTQAVKDAAAIAADDLRMQNNQLAFEAERAMAANPGYAGKSPIDW